MNYLLLFLVLLFPLPAIAGNITLDDDLLYDDRPANRIRFAWNLDDPDKSYETRCTGTITFTLQGWNRHRQEIVNWEEDRRYDTGWFTSRGVDRFVFEGEVRVIGYETAGSSCPMRLKMSDEERRRADMTPQERHDEDEAKSRSKGFYTFDSPSYDITYGSWWMNQQEAKNQPVDTIMVTNKITTKSEAGESYLILGCFSYGEDDQGPRIEVRPTGLNEMRKKSSGQYYRNTNDKYGHYNIEFGQDHKFTFPITRKVSGAVGRAKVSKEFFDKLFLGDSYLRNILGSLNIEVVGTSGEMLFKHVFNMGKIKDQMSLMMRDCSGLKQSVSPEVFEVLADNLAWKSFYRTLNETDDNYELARIAYGKAMRSYGGTIPQKFWDAGLTEEMLSKEEIPQKAKELGVTEAMLKEWGADKTDVLSEEQHFDETNQRHTKTQQYRDIYKERVRDGRQAWIEHNDNGVIYFETEYVNGYTLELACRDAKPAVTMTTNGHVEHDAIGGSVIIEDRIYYPAVDGFDFIKSGLLADMLASDTIHMLTQHNGTGKVVNKERIYSLAGFTIATRLLQSC